MAYILAITKAGKTILCEKYYSSRHNKKGIVRSENIEKTKEAQEKANHRKAVRAMTIKLNANFEYGDYHLVLTYRQQDRPETAEEAKRDREKFLRRLRTLYKKMDTELRYVIVTEFGKRGALHHHLVINHGVDTLLIQKNWEKGRCQFNIMDESGEYSKLAAYLLKNRKYWKEHGGKGRQCSSSRNLFIPETKKYIISTANGYYEKPRAKKGYYIAPDTEWHGHREDGWPYMSYILVKENGKRGSP